MTHPLDHALKRLADEVRADAALVWFRTGRSGGAVVIGGYPVGSPAGAPPCTIPAGAAAAERDPARLTDWLPDALLRELPAAPASARSLRLTDDVSLTLIWCDVNASRDLGGERQRQALDDLRVIAGLSRDLHVARGDVELLRAAVNGLEDGIVMVNPALNEVAVNQAAADLFGLPTGRQPAADFHSALEGLRQRVLNRPDFNSTLATVAADPEASVESMWSLKGSPRNVLAVSKPVHREGFRGRIWVFYDESRSQQDREALEYAHELLRASADGMLDPQVLLEAVRDGDGEIIDFTFRDVNNATCNYLGMARDDLIGRSLVTTMPNIQTSGLLARFAQCTDTHEPMVLEEAPYDNQILSGPRHYDIRGNHVGSEFITLTWCDVTERMESARRIVESEEQFRLLAENSGDVVAHLRHGVISWVSPSVTEILGAPPEYWIGRDMRETVPHDELENQAAIIGRVVAGEDVITRSRVLSVDGKTHWIHLHGRPFRNADGEPDGLTVAFRLIDDEVRIEQEAEESRRQQARADARYRRLMDNSSVGMAILTTAGRFETVNQALCDFFGYDAETLKTKTWQELTAGESLEHDFEKREDMLAGRIDSCRFTKQYIHADGHLIWADLSLSCLRDARGQVEYFISQMVDITAEMESRRQIAQRDQQNRALTQRLQEQTERLRSELKIAGSYVNSLLPGDLKDGPVRVSQRYLPSRELGGDCFDYRWIDDDHLIIYLIDVSGHGIAPALESISVHNLLRSGSLPAETLLEPGEVLAELNGKFPMDEHGGNYFTMWYGVYEASSRTLRYASAGHPPALVFTEIGADPVRLSGQGVPVGMFGDTEFSCETYPLPPDAEIVLYSDGAFEFPVPDGATWSLDDFVAACAAMYGMDDWTVDELARKLQARTVAGLFSDDCSLLRLRFA